MKRKVALIMAAVLMVVSLGACSSTTSSSYGTESVIDDAAYTDYDDSLIFDV